MPRRTGSGIIDIFMAKSDTRRIAIVGYNGCSSWITAGMLELFAIANLPRPASGRARPAFDCFAVSENGRPVRASHGVRIATVAPRGSYDAVIAPPLWSPSLAELQERAAALDQRLTPHLRRLASRAAIVASACSGAVLLAQAGLLAGCRATTCWWLADWFAKQFPEIRLDAGKLVVADRNRWTAAAGTAYLHLCLELVKRFAGAEIAAATARLALVEPRRGSQSPFLARDVLRSEDATGLAGRAGRWIESRIGTGIRVADLAQKLGTTERTLNRHFRAAFGVAPLAYLQSRRIASAKRALASRDDALERIVEQCGYADVSSFRRLFTREVGMTPSEYRLRFRS